MDTGQTLVFRPSRGKIVGMLLGSAVFVVAGTFKVGRVGTKEMVVFSFSQRYRGPRRLARLNVHLVGADAAVATAGLWNVRMDQLADVLNRYRERYRGV